MKLCDRYGASPHIVFRKEGKEGLLYDSRAGDIETLNETGLYIWTLCNGRNRVEDVVNKAKTRYRGNKGRIEKETKAFLKNLINSKFLEVYI